MQSPTGAPSTAVPMNTVAKIASPNDMAPAPASDARPPAGAGELKQLDDRSDHDRGREQREAGIDEVEPQREHGRALTPEECRVVDHPGQRIDEQAADDELPDDGRRATPAGRQQTIDQVERDLAAVCDHEGIGPED